MTDELTPQEQEALKNLPRERMPVGLEARVVDAMRDRGFIAKRRRTIEITNSRMAGLLAASVALMIGAYSIGLHRGGDDVVLSPAPTVQIDDRPLRETPAETRELAPATVDRLKKAERPVVGGAEGDVPESQTEAVRTPPSRSDEAMADRTERQETEEKQLESRGRDAGTLSQETFSPAARLNEPSGRALGLPPTAAPSVAAKRPLTFLLNGSPVVVDADSTRVMQGERGRILIIYTSDGIIRIPLADSN